MSTLADTVENTESNEKIAKSTAVEGEVEEQNEKRSSKKVELPEVVREIKKERTKNTSTYLMSDGSKKLEIYGQDIRFKKNGEWVDYDATITELDEEDRLALEELDVQEGKYVYANAEGKYKHYFAKDINEDSPVIMTRGDYVISFAPKKQENKVVVLDEVSQEDVEIVYANEDNSIELEYVSLTTGVKESIVLNKNPDTNIFDFKLDLTGTVPEINEVTKEITLVNDKEHVIATVAPPNIIDSKGTLTMIMLIMIELSEDKHTLQLW